MSIKWTDEQTQILDWFHSGKDNAQAQALPGCTKTSTCIGGINTSKNGRTLYAVFGKRNQLEAEEKISNANVAVKTWHSVGYSFVLENWRGVRGDKYAEYNRIKNLYPDAPKQIIFKTAELVKFLKNTFIAPNLIDATKTAAFRGIDPGQYSDAYPLTAMAEMALKSIGQSLEYPKDKKISFEDMFWLPIAKSWARKIYDLVVCDEQQDLNAPQMELATTICNGRLFAVGDQNQAIYGFRGALADSMEEFKKRLNAISFKLTTNFRCSKRVIGYAQTFMPELKHSEFAPEGILETINDDKMTAQILANDVILSRKNAPLMPYALSFIRKGIPAMIEGKDIGQGLIDIIEDLEADSVVNLLDKLQDWEQTRIQRASGWFASSVIELVQDQAQTIRALSESCISVEDIKNKINKLFQDSDYNRVPCVILSTVHKFKGRQAKNVNLLMDSFKGRKGANPEEIKQEENVFKVAITRSEHRLSLVSPAKQ